MNANEYFGDWMQVIDKSELVRIIKWLNNTDKSKLCPTPKNIFKALQLCSLHDCKAVFIGQDPYPQKGVATGILFGNSLDTPENKLSPSLKVVKEAAINYEIPHNNIIFDNSLESWAKQGTLMINSAFTCEVNKPGSHFKIWEAFVGQLIRNLTLIRTGLIFVLFGNQAKYFKSDICGISPYIIETYHPSYYARNNEKMPNKIFIDINNRMQKLYNSKFKFYKETEYGNC